MEHLTYDHPIHGQLTLHLHDGSREAAEGIAQAHPNIIIHEVSPDNWAVEVPSICGAFLACHPGDYVGVTPHGRAILVHSEEVTHG